MKIFKMAIEVTPKIHDYKSGTIGICQKYYGIARFSACDTLFILLFFSVQWPCVNFSYVNVTSHFCCTTNVMLFYFLGMIPHVLYINFQHIFITKGKDSPLKHVDEHTRAQFCHQQNSELYCHIYKERKKGKKELSSFFVFLFDNHPT